MSEPRRLPPRYEPRKLLGKGGMGKVLLAHDREQDRPVAVKVLAKELLGNAEVLARFRREALAQTRVNHPGIVRLYDFDLDGPTPYLAMELVEGMDLAALLRAEGTLPPARIAAIARDLGGALDALHASGVLHRDLKPANVMIRESDGSALVMDLGLAGVSDATMLTRTGQMVGTPRYFAPEMVMGLDLGPSADQFQVAAILFECSTGVPLVNGKDIHAVLATLTSGTWTPFPGDCALPPPMRAALMRGAQLDPSRRYASCADLARALAGEELRETEVIDLSEVTGAPIGGPRPPGAALAPALVAGPDAAPAGMSPARRFGPAIFVLVFLASLFFSRAAPPPPADIRFEVLGDALVVSFLGGAPDVHLEARLPGGEERELPAGAPGGSGRRRVVLRPLPADAEVEARLAWEGGQGATGSFRRDEPALRSLALATPGMLRADLRRPLRVRWGGGQAEHRITPEAPLLPAPPGGAPNAVLGWTEGGLEFSREVSIRQLHEDAVRRLEGFTGGFDPLERRRAFLADPGAEGTRLDAEAEAWEELAGWIPALLAGPLPRGRRRDLLALAWNWQRLRAALARHRGEDPPVLLPPGTAGAVGHTPLELAARIPVRGGDLTPALTSRDGLGYDEASGSFKIAPNVASVIKNLREPDSTDTLEFRWPDAPREGVLEVAVRLMGINPEVQLRIVEDVRDPEFQLELWHPRPAQAQRPRWDGVIAAWIPADLAPAPGAPVRLEVTRFYEATTTRLQVQAVRVRAIGP